MNLATITSASELLVVAPLPRIDLLMARARTQPITNRQWAVCWYLAAAARHITQDGLLATGPIPNLRSIAEAEDMTIAQIQEDLAQLQVSDFLDIEPPDAVSAEGHFWLDFDRRRRLNIQAQHEIRTITPAEG
jgi:hypothetical protein